MRVTAPPVTIKDIWDALVADYGVTASYGLLLETNLDSKVSLAKADVSALATAAALTAAKAVIDAIVIDTAGIAGAAMRGTDSVPTTPQRGTDGAALASAYTAGRAAYLDNIDSSLKELFYEHFGSMVDDLPDLVVTGTATNFANLTDNDTATNALFDDVNDYVEINFYTPVYIKEFRHFGEPGPSGNGRYKIQAYIDGSWTDVKTAIVVQGDSWSSWISLTTPSVAIQWRVIATTLDTGWTNRNFAGEFEFKGVRLG